MPVQHPLAEAGRGIAPPPVLGSPSRCVPSYEYLRSEDLIDTSTAKIKLPGARKLRAEIYADAEDDLMLAWVGDQPGSTANADA